MVALPTCNARRFKYFSTYTLHGLCRDKTKKKKMIKRKKGMAFVNILMNLESLGGLKSLIDMVGSMWYPSKVKENMGLWDHNISKFETLSPTIK